MPQAKPSGNQIVASQQQRRPIGRLV